MGKFSLWLLIVLGLVAVMGMAYFSLQQRIQDAFLGWVADFPEVHFDFEKVRFAGLGVLKFENLRIAGEGFSLYFPTVFLRLRLLSWLGFEEGPVFLASSNRVSLQISDWSFMQALTNFDLRKIPSFSLRVKELVWEKEQSFTFSRVELSKTSGGLDFSAFKDRAAISGHFDFDRTVTVGFDFPLQENFWKGEVRCSLNDGVLQGYLKSPFDVSFASRFTWDRDRGALYLNDVFLESAKSLLTFQGWGSIDFSKELGLVKGELQGLNDKVFEVGLQVFFKERPLQAFWDLKEKSGSASLRGELLSEDNGKLYFQVKPGSSLQGMAVSGEGYLGFENDELVLELSSASCLLDNNPFWSELGGEGNLRGVLRFGKRGLEDGHLFFASQELTFKEWQLKEPLIELQFAADGTASLWGKAIFLGGRVQLGGTWRKGSFEGKGELSDISLQSLVASFGDLPLGGTLDGKIDIEGKKDELRFELLLEGGEIFWGPSYLAEVSQGQLLLRSMNDFEAQLSLKGKEGEAKAFLAKKGERIEVALGLQNFLFESQRDGYELAFQVSGNLELKKGEKERAFRVVLNAPLWRWAGLGGRDLVFEGLLEGNKLEVRKLETGVTELGKLQLSGWLIPFEEAYLEGEIAGITLPENQFALQGELKEGSLSIKGPWEGVEFALRGKGRDLLLRGRQLGKSFELLFEGKLSLPGKGESLPLASYLSPENWDKGFLRIEGLDLRSLGIPLLESYQIESSGDLLLELDSEENNWMLRIEDITFAYPELPLLLGNLEGRFDGEKMLIKRLFLEDASQSVQISLEGALDLEKNLLDATCFLKVDPFLDIPWREFLLRLHGEGKVRLWGELEKPQVEGEVFLQEAKVLQGERELLSLTSVKGQISQEKLHILEGEVALSGINGVFSGDLTSEGMNIALSFSGDCSKLGLGEVLSGRIAGEANLSGSWKQPRLRGSLLVEEGSWDYARQNQSSSRGSVFSLESIEKALFNLPFDLEFKLQTSDAPFTVKTRFMEIALAGSLLLRAGGGKSSLSGNLQVVDGFYNLVMRKIPLAGKVYFGELFGLEPQLDLYGLCEVDGYEIRLTAQGPLDDYQLKLTSEPALSREEILSLLFTGDRNAYASLSDINIGPLFWGLFSFLTGDKGNFLEGLSGFLNLEINPVFSDGSWFYELTLEKRLGNDLIIGYTQDLSGEDHSAVYFDLNVNKNWSFKAEIDEKKGLSWELEFTTRF
ncbi:MAG: translocation and assembly module TamB [Candidatus Atribacteria bacterium]|nr:translocation and assembly module TamB [Candidatus Atribacteria bacterium]